MRSSLMGIFEKPGTGDVRPVGIGFRPTENELIFHYLKRKIQGLWEDCELIPEINIYRWQPQGLFEQYDKMSALPSDGRECFFFCTRKGSNRMTETGYWKETRKRHIVNGRDRNPIWYKKILVYHEGRQPKGKKSHYSMHEYHLCSPSKPKTKGPETELMLCRVINKEDKITCPDNPSSGCIDPDPVIPGASTTVNHSDDIESPQICRSSNCKDKDADTREMMEYYECLEDAEPQLLFNNDDEFLAGGCSSSNAIDPSFPNLDDINAMSVSDLVGSP
ncbi:hypothetical protein MLD38_033728 [Melastoma candidum]|uniref:Uncharacterized protein n=1 Tax=Melastoma candidum TaxID=119954 RepID=A0ACB9M893_9MYRT|nr:hypothetical protein MLD38_033728 [Melastoma candidum]